MELESPYGIIIGLLAAVLTTASMMIISLKYPPKWEMFKVLAPQWRQINIGSFIVSLSFAGAGAFIFNENYVELYRAIGILALGVLSYCFTQAIFTDFKLRRADGRILFIANIVSLVAGGTLFLTFDDKNNLALYVIFALVATVFLFIKPIGASDARSFQLMILSGFPIIALSGLKWALIFMIAMIALYAIVEMFKTKNFKFSFLLKRLSLPMVPMIIGPTLLAVILSGVLPTI